MLPNQTLQDEGTGVGTPAGDEDDDEFQVTGLFEFRITE